MVVSTLKNIRAIHTNFRKLTAVSISKEVQDSHLLDSLVQYALLPSPINGYVSLSVDVLDSVAEILQLAPKDFKQTVIQVDPLSGTSLLRLARENRDIQNMPFMKVTDSKKSYTYQNAFKAIADLYNDEPEIQ